MAEPIFITIKDVLLDLATCRSIDIRIAQDEFDDDNPNLGFELVIWIKGIAAPKVFRFASKDEAVAQKNELLQHLRSHGHEIRSF